MLTLANKCFPESTRNIIFVICPANCLCACLISALHRFVTGTKLHPNNEDLCKLRECIHLRLGPKALMKTRLNTNTQKNESVNRTLTKTNPKFGTWRRTLPGRIHGGVHMRNFVIAESCTLQNCLSFLVFDHICSCHMTIISVLYIFQLSLHKTAVNFSTNGFTSGLHRG
jgi:hypothetical protein